MDVFVCQCLHVSVLKGHRNAFNMPRDRLGKKKKNVLGAEMVHNSDSPHWSHDREGC